MVTDRQGGAERILAFDAGSGALLWTRADPVDFDPHQVGRRHGNGPKATAVTDGQKVWGVGIAGRLQCLDAASGRVFWSVVYPAQFGRIQPLPGGRAQVNREENVIVPIGNGQGAPVPLFGYTGSPLLAGKLLVAPVGGERVGTIVAFHAETGEVVWKSLSENVSYSSPVLATIGGVEQVVVMTGPRVVGLALADGRLLWSHPFQIQYDESISTPVVAGDLVLVTGDGYPLTALRIASRAGGMAAEVAWENHDLSSYLSSMVALDGHVFGMNDGGELVCADLAEGRSLWYGGNHGYYCTPLIAQRQILALNEKGRLLVVAADPGAYRELAELQLADEPTWTAPAISGSRLYVRSEGYLRCFELAN